MNSFALIALVFLGLFLYIDHQSGKIKKLNTRLDDIEKVLDAKDTIDESYVGRPIQVSYDQKFWKIMILDKIDGNHRVYKYKVREGGGRSWYQYAQPLGR